MPEQVTLSVNGEPLVVPAGTLLAVALADFPHFRRSVLGQPRRPVCGMGTCFECRVTIDGQPHQRSCQILCRDGMEVTIEA